MAKTKEKAGYSAKDITVLEGLEPVRLRPGMYIGTTGPRGLHHLCGLERKRRRMGRGDHRLSHTREPLRQHLPAAQVELGEDVVEEQQGRLGQELCLGEQQREDGEALFPLRAELAEVTVAAGNEHVVEMRAEPGGAAVDVLVHAPLERFLRRRLRLVPEPRARQAELVRARGERRRQRCQRRPAELDQHCAERRDALGPRFERRAVRQPRLHPPQRRVPLRERGLVLLRHACASRKDAAEYPVEVGAPRSRAALDDGEAIRCEDKGRELAAKRLRRRQPSALQPRLLRLSLPERHRCLDGRRPTLPGHQHARSGLPETDQLTVVAGARRETLRGEVERLEQVGLADAVAADDEHDPWCEVEVERRVRPVLTERYAIDDQPARRIGMIRYT